MMIAKYRPQPASVGPFNELMNEFLGKDIGQFFGSDDLKRSLPSVNIVERENDLQLQLLAPGFSKEDLKIRVENDVLTISAEKKVQELNEKERYTRREFSHSAFSRSFRLPELVKTDEIKAGFKDGVLQLNIPKADAAKPKAREISIG